MFKTMDTGAHEQVLCTCREEISQKRMNSIRGIDNHERLDEELYQDFETDDARKVQSHDPARKARTCS